MSRNVRKKNHAVLIVLIIALVVTAVAVGCALVEPYNNRIRDSWDDEKEQAKVDLQDMIDDYRDRNDKAQAEWAEEKERILHPPVQPEDNPAWPEASPVGVDIVDLSDFPLDNITREMKTRAELMNNGLLLVNEWHSRPADFDESSNLAGVNAHPLGIQAGCFSLSHHHGQVGGGADVEPFGVAALGGHPLQSMERLIQKCKTVDCWGGKAPNILVVCPPPLGEGFHDEVMGPGCVAKSVALPPYMKAVAERNGVHYLNAGEFCEFNPVDFTHLTSQAHRQLAAKLAEIVPGLID